MPNVSDEFICDANEAAHKLSYCEARIERVVNYLDVDDWPDINFVIGLLREALIECRKDRK